MPEPTPSRRRGRLLRYGAAVLVLLCLAAYLAVQQLNRPESTRCVVVSGDGDGPGADGSGSRYELTPEMAGNAATIAAVGTSEGLPERAVTIAIATAMQESGLRNIDYGDRDSVGLFQQRPSKGWGTVEQIMDPAYSARKFYDGLRTIPGYSRLPLTVAAQKVQRSGFPQAYAKHEPDATLLAAAFTGRADGVLSCRGLRDRRAGSAETVWNGVQRDFGAAASDGRAKGRTLTLPVGRALSDGAAPTDRRGWELAHWAVAQAQSMGIERVTYGGREWSGAGWSAARGVSSRDEVRITVTR
ncbi:hypothetical protein [Streptomyces sp. NPDC060194]|uniref:hypothetical protein n=1 Tax=Streptomyces sp. NPDC060194 TaxID=3347069 RepID=UPI0036533CAF